MNKLEGDSKDYELITRAIEAIPNNMSGMTCEIGLRKGGGTQHIMEALAKKPFPYKVHVGVDPYGNIVYHNRDGVAATPFDYTNNMRDESIGKIYTCAMKLNVNFIFINLEDSEFFERYDDGIPVYSDHKHLLKEFVFVHFDGPHQFEPLLTEFDWFDARMSANTTIVFDDIGHYDHNRLETHVFERGWKLMEKTNRKASYQKV